MIVLVSGLAARLGTIALRTGPCRFQGAAQRTSYLAVAVGAIVTEVAVTLLLGHSPPLASGLSCLVAFGVGYVSYQTQGYRERLIACTRRSP